MRRSLAVLALGVLVACSEQATSPQDTLQPAMSKENAGLTVRLEDEFSVEGQRIGDCGDWDVLTDYVVYVKWMQRLDKAGQPVQEIVRLKSVGRSVYYNSSDPTKVVQGLPGEHEIDHWSFVDGAPSLVRVGGVPFMVRIPHYGLIFAETGSLVIDLNTGEVVSAAGHKDYTEGNVAALCDYLR